MNLALHSVALQKDKKIISISGSKSESNRLLLLQALYPGLQLENISNSDDSEVMVKALASPDAVIDIHHAGTAMRFLTAYFATQTTREILLTGSSRMKERPVKVLVEALQQLGAQITYEALEGCPPLRIAGTKIIKSKVSLQANVSSQYISALLLIAPKLENGLELTLEGEITSVPYIKMTLALLNEIGVSTSFEGNRIQVMPLLVPKNDLLVVESDWSSASYWYSIVALSAMGVEVQLNSYKQQSLQGDSVLVEIYKDFGVTTVFKEHTITLKKTELVNSTWVAYDLKNAPDIAQTIAVTCFGLGMACHLTGLHTLKIKETDRLQALQNELTKLGAVVHITPDSLILEPSDKITANVAIQTYQDHRMAMAFAPLALKTDLIIEEAEVVSKSYPNFWNDLRDFGFAFSEV